MTKNQEFSVVYVVYVVGEWLSVVGWKSDKNQNAILISSFLFNFVYSPLCVSQTLSAFSNKKCHSRVCDIIIEHKQFETWFPKKINNTNDTERTIFKEK